MRKRYLHSILILIFLFNSLGIYAQKDKINIPELDIKKKTFVLKFSPDSDDQKVLSSYVKGTTRKDSLFFKAELSDLVERAMVTVLLKNKDEEAHVAIVKKHWKDIKRSGKTKNGIYREKFDTSKEFGIIVWSDKPTISFDMAVWTSGEIRPESGQLFYAVNGNLETKNNAAFASHNETDGNLTNQGNMFTYIIIGALLIIIIFLVLLLSKRRKGKTIILLLLFFFPLNGIVGQTVESTARNFAQNAENYGRDQLGQLGNFANDIRELATGGGNYSFLDPPNDEEDVPDTDPAGQPQLPSSCLLAYPSRDFSDANNSNGNQNNSKNNTNSKNNPNLESDAKGSSSSTEFRPMDMAGQDSNNKPDNGPGENTNSGDGESLKLPRYDESGHLKDHGDFPNAPEKIDPTNGSPFENPFIQGDSEGSTNLRQPKYDENGHLKNPGDFPDSPLKIDPTTGIPPINPFIEGSESEDTFVRQPKYTDDGKLIDAGDFPDAPQQIDPNSVRKNNNQTGNNSSGLSTKAGGQSSSMSTNARTGSNNGNGSNSSNGNDNGGKSGNGDGRDGGGNNDDNDPNKKEGCDCLQKAYERLEDRRYRFEKLRIITARIDRITDFGLAFGDDVSGVHGVSGLVWQTKRKEIVQGMMKFDNTYESKYQEMVKDLYDILMEIDRCEALMGFENWYSSSGFIYYTFMKDRYKRKDRKL